MSLYPTLAKKLGVPMMQPFKLKPQHGGEYPAQYCITEHDFIFCREKLSDWVSVGTNLMQMRIFLGLMRGDVEVVKNEQGK